MTQYATFACIVAWLSAVGFAWAFVAQGGEIESAISNITSTDSGIDTSRYPKGPEGYIQCHSDAKGLDQQVECGKLMR